MCNSGQRVGKDVIVRDHTPKFKVAIGDQSSGVIKGHKFLGLDFWWELSSPEDGMFEP